MNAQIGKNLKNKFGLHNWSNWNGEHLTDFTQKKRLTCLNTKFQKTKRKLWTYTNVNNAKAQIDYSLKDKKRNYSALNCVAYSSFNGVSPDHRIVTAKILQSIRRNAARTTTTVHYDWSLLNNSDIRNKYALILRNKLDAPTSNHEYENFVIGHLELATECIPTKQRVPWDTLAVIKRRADIKTTSLCIISMLRNLRKHKMN